MEIGLVQQIDIDSEMQQAYLDYAMSVIISRALPDARDGLKPVHRRILYAMYDMGLRPNTPFKKSARIVGEVLGKYHPHGDMAVYDAMARMAQDFSMRYPLVEGQGNFGSVDGDPPAAMRYTEARLQNTAMHMLIDIDKETVDFTENFDGTLAEPSVLPAAIPNLLVNGATGIAVGMATSIPPHNLNEVSDALIYLLQNWKKADDITVEDLMKFVKGPDFPTGGIILQDEQSESLLSAYSTGRGRVIVRASAHLEEMSRGRSRIIVTELPYMTNKSSLLERIANLAREEKIEGIADLRDESDRQGMRIVIEISKSANPHEVLRDLYKRTPMQSTFSLILLALVDGEPRLLSLKQALKVYLEHRLTIIRRRSEYELKRAEERAHILEGLRIALQNIDEVIRIIRRSQRVETAKASLRKRFKLSSAQAQAILDMPLRRLASLERKKIEDEYRDLVKKIRKLKGLLRSPVKIREVAISELQEIKELYGDRRRTHIAKIKDDQKTVSMLTTTDLTPENTVWLSVTPDGLISRSQENKMPRISGRNAPIHIVQANTRDTLYLVNKDGETAAVPVHAVPETTDPQSGVSIAHISPLADHQSLAYLFTLPPKDQLQKDNRIKNRFILTITKQGMVKKTHLLELPGPSASTFTLVKINQGDELKFVRLTRGNDDVLLVTAKGMAIRFHEDEVRPMGLVAAGVMGIKLHKGDVIVGGEIIPQAGDIFLLASDGTGKRVAIKHFPVQGRYGQGVQAWKLPGKTTIAGVTLGRGTKRVVVSSKKLAPKTIRLDQAPLLGRTARGKKVFELKSNNLITGLRVPQKKFFR